MLFKSVNYEKIINLPRPDFASKTQVTLFLPKMMVFNFHQRSQFWLYVYIKTRKLKIFQAI